MAEEMFHDQNFKKESSLRGVDLGVACIQMSADELMSLIS